MSIESLTGRKFGDWTVIGETALVKAGYYSWMCRCVCGAEKRISANNLRSRKTKSCGCIKYSAAMNGNWKGYKNIPSSYWTHIKHGARLRGIDVSMTIRDANDLFEEQGGRCKLTGLEISTQTGAQKTASLDRIDSSKHYEKSNCQWVHKDVNKMKNNLTEERFIELCQIIVNNKRNH